MKIKTTVQQTTRLPQQDTLQVVLACSAGLYQAGEYIMAKSKEVVPVDTGNLRASGFVALPEVEGTRVVVRLGYGGLAAVYALMVHENPRSGKTGGISPSGKKYKTWAKVGGWKYLERPILEAHAQQITLRFIKQALKNRGLA